MIRKKYVSLASSFIIMLGLGGVYAWSIFVPQLMGSHGFSRAASQAVFGLIIGIFPIAMIAAAKLEERFGPRLVAVAAAVLFSAGYLLASRSGGSFLLILIGIGLCGGIGTGFGYLSALSTPVKWFPAHRGLVMGISAAGFGLAATVLTSWGGHMEAAGLGVLDMFGRVGIAYGLSLLTAALFLHAPPRFHRVPHRSILLVVRELRFLRLLAGIFCGTFAGLIMIGYLVPIGREHGIDPGPLHLAVSVFALANFAGRIFWGWLSDVVTVRGCVVAALGLQAFAIFLTGVLHLSAHGFLLLAGSIGIAFGSCFVLFAKETTRLYGVANLGHIYPYVFLGYAAAGLTGPLTGGLLADRFGTFSPSALLAAAVSAAGAVLFVVSRPAEADPGVD